MDKDAQHLNLLEIFHYIVAGITALLACIPVLHLAIGIAMVAGRFGAGGKDAPPAFVGWLFIVFAALLILSGWVQAACLVIAGRMLRKRRAWTYCFVVACVACLMVPYGTVLGVLTIIVLQRDSVKARFAAGQPSRS